MQVYIVAGGLQNCHFTHSRDSMEASTEILLKNGGKAWNEVAKLPVVGRWKSLNGGRDGVRGLGIENGKFMITGERVSTMVKMIIRSLFIIAGGGENGDDNDLFNDVLVYDSVTNEWKTVARLSNKRKFHAMSLVSDDIANHCI